MSLFEKGLVPITRTGIVPIHFQVILFAVEFGNIYEFPVGAPGHVCQVLLPGLPGFQVNGLSGFYIINPDSYFVAFLARHRILDALLRCNPGGDIHNRIIGNHCFIHPVKCQLVSVWRPKDSAFNPKLIPVNRSAANNPLVLFRRDCRLFTCPVCYIEVVVFSISQVSIAGRKFSVGAVFRKPNIRNYPTGFQVVNSRAVRSRKDQVVASVPIKIHIRDISVFFISVPLDFIESESKIFFVRLQRIHSENRIMLKHNQLISMPLKLLKNPWIIIVKALPSRNKFVQRELFVLLGEKHACESNE